MTATLSTQIEIDDRRVPWVAGTQVKVAEIILDKIAHGWSPEEIFFQHPGLSLAQIYGALTYYYENQSELDEQIEREVKSSSELAARVSDQNFRAKLRHLRQSF